MPMDNNINRNTLLRSCSQKMFTDWTIYPHSKLIGLVKNYYIENGDIPEFMYAPAPKDKPKLFGFIVKEDGIIVTANDYQTNAIMLVFNENQVIDICPSETSIACNEYLYPDAKKMLLAYPSVGKHFSFCSNITATDFKERLYCYKNGVAASDTNRESEVDFWIYRNSVIVANTNGILSSTITFRKSSGFEQCYEVLLDADKTYATDFTVKSADIEEGLSLPILVDALKPQSMLIDRIQDSYFHRELVFTKDNTGKFTDYNIKTGYSTLKNTLTNLGLLQMPTE